MQSRDARFDGWFIAGITSTGIYCRPSCPAPVRPKRQNVRIFASAAAAQSAGFRSCKRCRPDATPGSPEWGVRDDLIGRAVRLIEAGEIDRVGVAGLAERLAVSERHLHRLLVDHLGATPIALARAHRGNLARILLETTTMPVTDVAWAAGFSSVRQFNDTIRAIYARTPSELRRAGPASERPSESTPLSVRVRLPARGPLDDEWLLGFLNSHGAPGITAPGPVAHRRSLSLNGGPGIATVDVHDGTWHAHVELTAISDLAEAIAATRRLLDLDADPAWIREHLDADPTAQKLLANAAGIRIPGATDGFAAAIATIVGQQVSVAGARTMLGRLVARHGRVHRLDETLREFPDAETLASADLTRLGLTNRRIRTIAALAERVADGAIDLGPTADRESTASQLLDVPGIGPWTVNVIRMRVLGDPDVLLANDLIITRLLDAIGAPGETHAQWSPWRSYVTTALWAQVGQGEAP
jgi:AraC family transcriptional regulator of adaptative response / DNA-3-methyladenine glycosylase II